jgi:hypothetical protein
MRMSAILVWTLKIRRCRVSSLVLAQSMFGKLHLALRPLDNRQVSSIRVRKDLEPNCTSKTASTPPILLSPHCLAFICHQVSRVAYFPYLSDVVVYNSQMLHFSLSITTVRLLRLPIIKPMNELQFTTPQSLVTSKPCLIPITLTEQYYAPVVLQSNIQTPQTPPYLYNRQKCRLEETNLFVEAMDALLI